MVTATQQDKKPNVFPVVVTPAFHRVIVELMAHRRQFNRSQLLRDALIEMADRDLAPNWRELVGMDEQEVA